MDLKEKFALYSFDCKDKEEKLVYTDTALEISKEFIEDAIMTERKEWGDRIARIGRIYIQKVNKLTDEMVLEITELERLARNIDVSLTETVQKLNVEGMTNQHFTNIST